MQDTLQFFEGRATPKKSPTYPIDSLTYGAELEFGNCKIGSPLPEGASWNDQDYTCVSSTGIANDPKGITYQYGGEINTKPFASIDDLVDHIQQIQNCLHPSAIINYRSNLHIHVRVPGLREDLENCKKLLRYIDTYQQEAFDIVETIPEPSENLPPEVLLWARKRRNRRHRSHQYKLPKARVEAALAAKTTTEFFEEQVPMSPKGRMYITQRAGINLRSLSSTTNTIEFRHFPGTLDAEEMRSAIRWCQNFLDAALNWDNFTPTDILNEHGPYTFPDFQPYEFETEQVYQWTNVGENSRETVLNRLKYIRQHLDIDDMRTTSAEVYKLIKEVEGTSPLWIFPK
jgi:hypothetical protein